MTCICHRLYSDPKTKPRYNLMFILSGGGNFNYFGTKALLDEQLDDPGTCICTIRGDWSSILIRVHLP